MPYDWDPAKRASNLAKHGVDFATVSVFQWETALVRKSAASDEPRLVALGVIGRRLHVLVYSIETGAVRVISLRRANRREYRRYEEA